MTSSLEKAKIDVDEISNGPLEQRECRDLFCALLFIINVGAMIYCSIYAYTKGNPSIIYRGTDIDNTICGEGVHNGYPYLYFTYPTGLDSSKRVCVSKCPQYESGILTNLQCSSNSNVNNCNYDYVLSQNGTTINSVIGGLGINNYGYNSYLVLDRVCFPTSESMAYFDYNTLNSVSSTLSGILSTGYLANFINDIKNNWYIILTGLAIAVVVSLIIIMVMRYLVGCIVWLSLIGTFLFIVALGFMLAYSGNMFSSSEVAFFGIKIPMISGDNTYYKYYGIACWVGAGLYLIFLLCCCCRIRLAVAVCKCAGAFIIEVCSVVFVPIIMALVTVALWVVCVTCMIWLVSSAPFIANGDIFTSLRSFSDTSLIRFYYFVFATLWCNAFVQAVTTFVIASACCMWYYSHGPGGDLHIPVIRSFGRVFRYHSGSIALGSILVAIIQFLEFILEIIKKQVQTTINPETNCCVRCVFNCGRCCLACLQRIVKFINKNAYILIALKGQNFCSSAKLGFQIVWSNPLRFGSLIGIGTIIMFIGKLAISCGTTAAIYAIITFSTWSKILTPLLFLLLIFIISYAVASIFMSVYEQSIDVLLICFIVDQTSQKAKGSKALYAPEQLQQLLDQ